jgi:L-asparaginase
MILKNCSRLLLPIGLLSAVVLAAAEKPKIAVFSGPTSTIQSNQALITSNKARAKYGLPPLTGADGQPAVDVLRPQRLAAPARIYIEAFSAHPLEADVAELYGPPDGYLDAQGNFSKERKSPADKAVYEAVLDPKDGLYPLPYMARQVDGKAWDDNGPVKGQGEPGSRQHHYPDGSRFFEEMERLGAKVFEKADFDFYRAAPSGGYTKGLPAARRTDAATGDIPPEKLGEDYFPYGYPPPRAYLAKATNVVQQAMATGKYAGGLWLEGSPGVEDSSYWLNLLIDTDKPLAANSSQRDRGNVSPDGDANMVSSIRYIVSKVWADEKGADKVGMVLHQDGLIYASREITKGDARPGGYVATGGDGGLVGNMVGAPVISYVPNRKHTSTSDVRISQLPASATGVKKVDGKLVSVTVPIKNAAGELLPGAIPNVTLVKGARWSALDNTDSPEREVDILARLEEDLRSEPLSGMIAEGTHGGSFVRPAEAALKLVVMHGIPVVKVNRGGTTGYMRPSDENLMIEGSNLTATKARLLLMACLMKFGTLPPAADPAKPTPAEIAAVKDKLKLYQAVFSTH